MVEICVSLERRRFYNEENGFGIYICRTKEDDKRVTVKGVDMPTASSCWIHAFGKWEENPKYGREFIADAFEIEKSTTEEGVIDYFQSLKIGIGGSRAKALYAHFGSDVLNILDKEPEKILEVSCVPQQAAQKYMNLVHAQTTRLKLKRLFSGVPGVTDKTIRTIVKKWEDKKEENPDADAYTNILKNPYRLYGIIGYNAMERFASGLPHIPVDFPPRLTCAAFHILTQNELRGHPCMEARDFAEKTLALLNAPDREPVAAVKLTAHLKKMTREYKIIRQRGMIFLRHSYREEDLLAKNLMRLKAGGSKNEKSETLQKDVDNVLQHYMEENKIRFAPEQRQAVFSAFLHPVSIITGGPGTGKTTLTKAILEMDRFLNGKNSFPVLLAPTGKAAKRLSESTGKPARTIHSAIGYTGESRLPEDLTPEENCFKDASIIIVDEASMLDQMIASWFVQLVPQGVRVVFVGDADQLPSVGAGDVLHEMICSGVIPVTRLKVIFRQQKENLIVTNAGKMRCGDANLSYGEGFNAVDTSVDTEQIKKAVDAYVRSYRELGAENVMLLCPYKSQKRTIVNTRELNRLIQAELNPAAAGDPIMRRGGVEFHIGDRVMQLKNQENVLNGDVGVVTDISEKVNDDDSSQTRQVMTVEFNSDVSRDYSRDMLDELDLAYACTVHKSQGSEYSSVILVLSNKHCALLQRNLVYTAITRATQTVTLIGDVLERRGRQSALKTAILKVDARRLSLLAERLKSLSVQIIDTKKMQEAS